MKNETTAIVIFAVFDLSPLTLRIQFYHTIVVLLLCSKKGKGFPYSIPSVGPGADPSVQAVSLQVTVSHPPGGRLPLLSLNYTLLTKPTKQ